MPLPRRSSGDSGGLSGGRERLAKEHPIIAGCCAYADYDGWLVTTMDKRRLPRLPFALAYTSGWYPEETTPESTGRWTHQTATLSFSNPQADATFSLDYAARVPQAVTVSVGDQLLQSFVADASGRRRRQRIPLPRSGAGKSGQGRDSDHCGPDVRASESDRGLARRPRTWH